MRIISVGSVDPIRLAIGKLLELDKHGFQFSPLVKIGGPVTKWVFGKPERHEYVKGSFIAEDFGHIYNKRKVLKAVVKQWQHDNKEILN